MRIGNTGADDLLNEAQFVLRDDGRWSALLLLRLLTLGYRALKMILLLVCRLRWRRGTLES